MLTRNSSRLWHRLLSYLFILALSACGSNSSNEPDNSVPESTFTLPGKVTQSRLGDSGSIRAYIQVDGGTRQEMQVGSSAASVQINGLSTGPHEFTIILEYHPDTDPLNGWSGISIMDENPESSVFDFSMASSPGSFLAIWTQAEPDSDSIVRYPWARIGF